MDFPGLAVTRYQPDEGIEKGDLTVLVEGTRELEIVFSYNTDVFEDASIQRMLEHYVHLLDAILNSSDQPVGGLAMLSDAEVHQVLYAWNQTAKTIRIVAFTNDLPSRWHATLQLQRSVSATLR